MAVLRAVQDRKFSLDADINSIPVGGSICLNLARMHRTLEISAADTFAVAQPGVIT